MKIMVAMDFINFTSLGYQNIRGLGAIRRCSAA